MFTLLPLHPCPIPLKQESFFFIGLPSCHCHDLPLDCLVCFLWVFWLVGFGGFGLVWVCLVVVVVVLL